MANRWRVEILSFLWYNYPKEGLYEIQNERPYMGNSRSWK